MSAVAQFENNMIVPAIEMSSRRPSLDSVTRARAGRARTPSPTPSEWEALAPPRPLKEQLKHPTTRDLSFAVTLAKLHRKIVYGLQPAEQWMRSHHGGWAIPAAIIIVLSFPPLAGQELVATMCGLTWGIGLGFLIVSLSTYFGELVLFIYFLTKRSERYESENIQFATLAAVIREGGFKIILMARFSAIPPHFTTAVLATCGTSMPKFLLATFLALPRQFAPVYIGYTLEQSINGDSSAEDRTHAVVTAVVVSVLVSVTVIALHYVGSLMAVKLPIIVYERRKRRQADAFSIAQSEERVCTNDVGEAGPEHADASASKMS
ncbi:hypothetical protein CONPUDRAFT_76496 [Coniophora puteana RWD-64-598 SS2]|uniref:Golgi apparatus membrane protein TVP38 n=1 Tax=Coniophora puteana (strain RWD-64-598) TaxID=741705 RepID=A0A5M3MD67_CONPW|nr:uncharacterized protein CONPUDRAFT_76496 [Coniophora puteana RWD-64-598 SS2]EIW76957.1 hypothetical protein CONPUDRAFT_76496 [Coniophora puteana RWD-64-598 SS2]